MNDFKKLKSLGNITLTEWAIKGDHCPDFEIYSNEASHEVFLSLRKTSDIQTRDAITCISSEGGFK